MEAVAQLVRASVCGSEGRGFETLQPPLKLKKCLTALFLITATLVFVYLHFYCLIIKLNKNEFRNNRKTTRKV